AVAPVLPVRLLEGVREPQARHGHEPAPARAARPDGLARPAARGRALLGAGPLGAPRHPRPLRRRGPGLRAGADPLARPRAQGDGGVRRPPRRLRPRLPGGTEGLLAATALAFGPQRRAEPIGELWPATRSCRSRRRR